MEPNNIGREKMEKQKHEFEFYDEEDGNGQKIVRVKKIRGLDDEQLGKKIVDTISTIKSEYRHLIIFWNDVSRSWDCEFRTGLVRLEKIWPEEKRKRLNPMVIKNSGRDWFFEGNREVPYKKIKAFMDIAYEKKRKSEIWKKQPDD